MKTHTGTPKKAQQIHKISSSLSDTKHFSLAALIIFVIIVGGGGLYILLSRAATTTPSIYLSPATTTVGPGGIITVQVRENSGSTGVNAVQANFSYPTSLLTCSTIDASTSAFGVEAQSTCTNGQVTLARGVSGGSAPLTGDQLVATITFTAATTGGTATLAFTSGTALVSASTNQDILGSLAATIGATYTVDTTAPTVSISAPANNTAIAYGSTTTITANATDGQSAVSKVDLYIDGVLKATLTTSPYTYGWSGATIGTHTLQAKATDTFNNVGTSATVSVTVSDQTPPTVSITAPATNTTVSGSAITLTAAAADNIGVANVQFKLDGTNLGPLLTASPYTTNWNTTGVASGSHTLTAVAKDANANSTTSSAITIIVDNTAPTVTITAPTAGTTLSGTTTITASAADNTGGSGLAKVEFYVDSNLAATVTTVPYTFAWNTTTAAYGNHTLTAKAYDKATPANVATSAGITVSVNNAIAGDINGDGTVNVLDLSILLSHFNTTNASSDLNHDGIVNVLDLSILLTNFGK